MAWGVSLWGALGVVVGCQERGIAPPTARHVAGVAAIASPPESPHLEADQNSEAPVEGVATMVSSLASLHPEAGRSPEKPVMVVVVEDLVSSPEYLHLQAVQCSEKGKYLGRMTQDRALKHRAPSLRRALRVYSSLTSVMVEVFWGVVGSVRGMD